MQGREAEYTYHFTESDVSELGAAVKKAKAAGIKTEGDVLKVTTLTKHITCRCSRHMR